LKKKVNEIYALDLPDFYKIFNEKLNDSTIDFIKGLEPIIYHDQLMETFGIAD